MCGILGFYLKRELNENDIVQGKNLLKKIEYRGPDYTGTWYDKKKGIFIGHNRLSIIDLSAKSNQPFTNKDSVLAFNGEIYNFKSLRDKYFKKRDFKTTSDTEVLSFFLNEFKITNLDELDGMFSFCFFKNDKLILANDIFSEKTLYYVSNHEGVYFCSEAGPLIKLLNLKPSKKTEIKNQFMSLGYILPPNTGFDNLSVTTQANLITIKSGKVIANTKYFSFPKLSSENKSFRKLSNMDIKKIKYSIIESVESRIYSDANMGIFLSSGIDSALVASIMKKELNVSPLALTISFNKNSDFNEAEEAKSISNYLGIEHVIEEASNINNHNIVEDVINVYNDLNDNTSIILIKTISNIAKKYFKVAISGNGGDEMFYGYGKHDFFYKYQKLLNSKLWNSILKKFNTNILFSNKVNLAINLSKYKNYNKVLAINNFPFMDQECSEENFFLFDKLINKNQNIFQDFRDFNLNYNLPNSIIQSSEKGSMRESIELRSPFLSRNIMNIVSCYDYRSLMSLGRKGVLKLILKDYLPNHLILEKKKGFIYPLDYSTTDTNLRKYKLLKYKKYIHKNYNWKKLLIRKMIYNQINQMY